MNNYNNSTMLLSLVFSLLLTTSVAYTYDKTEQIVKAEKVNGNSYYIKGYTGAATEHEGFISNAGFVITRDGVVVFDALGTPALADAMIAAIKKLTIKPIKLVITSHYHADHIYGLQSFKKLSAKIMAPKGALNYLRSDRAKRLLEARKELLFPQMDENVSLVEPDEIIDKDKTFSFGGLDFMVHYLGSVHSEGDMMLSVKQDKVLFSGDLIFGDRVPFIDNGNINNWLVNLKVLDNLTLDYLVPGHGKAASNLVQISKTTRNYLNFLLAQLKQAVAELTPFNEAYEQIDWSKFKHLPAFEQANRRNALAVYLYLEKL